VTPAEGLRRRLGADSVLLADEADVDAARRACAQADAIVVIAGLTHQDEGEYIPGGGIDLGKIDNPALEAVVKAQSRLNNGPDIGGDRADLSLPAAQIALIHAAAQSGKPMVVVIVAGSAIMVEDWIDAAPAAMQTFYSGMEGGTALAELLFGDASPSGRLPFSVARRLDDYPPFDRAAKEITYGPYHGYTLLEKEGRVPRFPFGWGLSYAQFAYRALKTRVAESTIEVQVSVRNDGAMDAEEVVLAFVRPPTNGPEGPKRLLRAFARCALSPGETRTVRLEIPRSSLERWDSAARRWTFYPGRYEVEVQMRDGSAMSAAIDLA